MPGDSIAIGVAYRNQNLDGTTGGGAVTAYSIISSTLTSPTIGATATDTVGFFGAALTARPAATNQAAPTTTAAAQISATQWGFSTSTQANAVITCVNAMQAALVSLGLIKGSN